MASRIRNFRNRLRSGDRLIGTFFKTPSSILADVLGQSALDVVCIDVEHAPFGRLEMDVCLGAFRSADMPCLVRVGDDTPTQIRNALDSGATGVVVPHVRTAAQAAEIVRAAHFGEGGRGYAGSPRAAGFAHKSMANHLADSAAQTAVIVQIEDIAALPNAASIAAVDGVDCLFIGRADLAVAMRKTLSDAAVLDAVRGICADARDAVAAVGMYTPDADELPEWIEEGASLFLLSSDQSLLLAGADALAGALR